MLVIIDLMGEDIIVDDEAKVDSFDWVEILAGVVEEQTQLQVLTTDGTILLA
jgi:hypothetical protein